MASPITVRPGQVFPSGTDVSAYPLTEEVEYARRHPQTTFSTAAEDTATVSTDGLALLSVDPGTYTLVGMVDSERRSMVFTTYGEGESGDTAPTNEIQTITMTASGGTWTATFSGQTTTALTFDVSAADLKTALAALNNLDAGDLTVELDGGVYTITFGGEYEGVNVAQLTVATGSLTGGSAVVATTQQGGA